jgi:hypothetical protein
LDLHIEVRILVPQPSFSMAHSLSRKPLTTKTPRHQERSEVWVEESGQKRIPWDHFAVQIHPQIFSAVPQCCLAVQLAHGFRRWRYEH